MNKFIPAVATVIAAVLFYGLASTALAEESSPATAIQSSPENDVLRLDLTVPLAGVRWVQGKGKYPCLTLGAEMEFRFSLSQHHGIAVLIGGAYLTNQNDRWFTTNHWATTAGVGYTGRLWRDRFVGSIIPAFVGSFTSTGVQSDLGAVVVFRGDIRLWEWLSLNLSVAPGLTMARVEKMDWVFSNPDPKSPPVFSGVLIKTFNEARFFLQGEIGFTFRIRGY